jgi:hypothetical protein
MTSAIDSSKPVATTPTTASVRANFEAARLEIEALQAAVTAAQANITALQGAIEAMPIIDLVAESAEQAEAIQSINQWQYNADEGLGNLATKLDLEDHAASSNPHPAYLTQAEGDAAYRSAAQVAASIGTHEAASNPHPVYLTQAEGDARYSQSAASVTGVAANRITYYSGFGPTAYTLEMVGSLVRLWEQRADET